MNTCFRFAPRGRERLQKLDMILDAAYGAPEPVLGNRSDPLDEAVYIILSFQTDLTRFKATWTTLKSAFPRWEYMEGASLGDVSDALRAGGLQWQKAKTIKRMLRAVRRDFGEFSLESLGDMDDLSAEKTLQRLPGLSWKGARCVLLYSLGRQVFPMDGNTFRVFLRTGVIPLSAVYRRLSLHDGVQEAVAPARRRRFHVNLVVHGQNVCLPRRPACAACPVVNFCPRRGLPHRRTSEETTRTSEPPARAVRWPHVARGEMRASRALHATVVG